MNQKQTEVEIEIPKDAPVVDNAFTLLWEKAHTVGELVTKLRKENEDLSHRLQDVERSNIERSNDYEKEISTMRSEILVREQELKKIRAEHTVLLSGIGHQSFSEAEREILKERIRDLITKINSFL